MAAIAELPRDEWITALNGPPAVREPALAELHALLLRAARFELGRRRPMMRDIPQAEIDDMADVMQTELTRHQREVFTALALNGVPIDVLAERLDTTRGALYKTLHAARRDRRWKMSLLGPDGPEVTCEECFERLDECVELELAGLDTDRRIPGTRARLEGCPACHEDHDSLLALAAEG